MQRERLTPDRIRLFKCPAETKQAFLFDTEAPRLAVRATAGAKSFVFEAKLNRQTIRRTIGDVKNWNLDDARTEARRLQTLIDQGIDPRELDREKEEAKAAAKAAQEAAKRAAEERSRYTLRALCNAYAEYLERIGKAKSAAATRSAFKCHVYSHKEIAAAPARDVTGHQVAAMVRKVREAGKERAAGILRSYLSAAYNAAKRAPFDSALPAELIDFNVEHNPVDKIPAIAVRARNRTLSTDELRTYLKALNDDLPDQALRIALLAGGQRMAQLLRAKVGDYNPDTATLRLWDGKGRRKNPREHRLPLAPRAAALVAALVARVREREKKRADKAGEAPADIGEMWLFSTHGKVAMTETTPGKRAAEISAGMKCERFNLLDIRRTCETMLIAMGVSKDTRAQLLSHGISGVQAAHYDRHSYTDEKHGVLIAWEARIAAIEKNEQQAANVVRLHSA